MLRIGNFDVKVVRDGHFALDGGAMFGVVPKVLWERLSPPDPKNRITLGLNSLLLQGGGRNILVDCGIGDKFPPKYREIYRIEKTRGLFESLKDNGVMPGDVDILILTHLHFDHAGGGTLYNEEGRAVPSFPAARVLIQEEEWKAAGNPDVRSRASYLPENMDPLAPLEGLTLLSGDHTLCPGVKIKKTGGHTKGHQMVFVEDEGALLIFWGDIIPTRNHLKVPYVMAYDTEPLVTQRVKEEVFSSLKMIGKETYFFFEHDPISPLVSVEAVEGGWKIVEGI